VWSNCALKNYLSDIFTDEFIRRVSSGGIVWGRSRAYYGRKYRWDIIARPNPGPC
jgi:hypothetical protein